MRRPQPNDLLFNTMANVRGGYWCRYTDWDYSDLDSLKRATIDQLLAGEILPHKSLNLQSNEEATPIFDEARTKGFWVSVFCDFANPETDKIHNSLVLAWVEPYWGWKRDSCSAS